MRLFAYSVYDKASNSFDRPFFANADGQAVRSFGDICHNEDHPIGAHPEDYSLYRIGVFETNNGEFEGESPAKLATGFDMIRQDLEVVENA